MTEKRATPALWCYLRVLSSSDLGFKLGPLFACVQAETVSTGQSMLVVGLQTFGDLKKNVDKYFNECGKA
ncbi:hypothetical protein XELAEV_18002683mg [Xenopus laevis]|nr:hypothetical protein XELAEV_18002683mg [Xenopus laevis]